MKIRELSLEELKKYFLSIGEKAFRANQVYSWLHQKLISDIDEMLNISMKLRDNLKANYDCSTLTIVKILHSKVDHTSKYLFKLSDGNVIESVLMKYNHGNSVCISTQVGCRMGCKFCASTLDGLVRNLNVSEMLEQIYLIQKNSGERISNIVLMGSGEPMDNFDNVVLFVNRISEENGLHISQRNITISTCGLIDKIKKLADLNLQITLAISLHAADDETRKELMPIAKRYTIEEILDACEYYFEKTGRRLSFEYSLVLGVNDSKEEADKLAKLLRGKNCHVNLIPVNPIKERNFQRSDKINVTNFKKNLEKYGINVTIRREMGADIQGACGQLRQSYLEDYEGEEEVLS